MNAKNADRIVASIFGSWFVYTAIWLAVIWWDEHSDTVPVFYDWAWPWVFGIAGAVGLAYAKWPSNKQLAAWSGGLMMACLLSRAFTVLMTWGIDHSISAPRAFFGAGVWLILGYSLGLIWTRLMKPMGDVRRSRG